MAFKLTACGFFVLGACFGALAGASPRSIATIRENGRAACPPAPSTQAPVPFDRELGEVSLLAMPASAKTMHGAGGAPATIHEDREPEETTEELASVLDERLAGEPTDGTWTDEIKCLAEDTVERVARGTRVSEASCSHSLCRFEVEPADAALRARIAFALSIQRPFSNGAVFRHAPGDPPRLIVYVFRQGRSQPIADFVASTVPSR